MALIPCPHCGNQISDKAITCPACGYQTEADSSDIAAAIQKSKMAKTLNATRKLLFIGGGILLVIAFSIFTSSAYRDRQNNYEEYMTEYEKALDMAEQNRGGFLGAMLYNSYVDIAEDWKEMADYEKEQLMRYKIAGAISIVCSGVLISKGILLIKTKER